MGKREEPEVSQERTPIPFDEALRRLVNTPPKPKKAPAAKPAKKRKPN